MIIRLGETRDVEQLIKMSWDYINEHAESEMKCTFQKFRKEYHSFFEKALTSGQWFVWVVEEAGKLVSHIYIELIQKVLRPGSITHPFAYMTNIYTVPEYRNMGLGSKLLRSINEWINENEYEFVIVWPNDETIPYYQKSEHMQCKEPIEYYLS